MLLWAFQHVVAEQSGYALAAAREVDSCLARSRETETELRDAGAGTATQERAEQIERAQATMRQTDESLWFWLQALLTIAANVSKCLWPDERCPIRRHFPDRGPRLRVSLGVPDDSPIGNRVLRNHFEHMDERLEEWWRDDERHNIARHVVGPLQGVVAGMDVHQLFEQFDPDQGLLAFHGDVFELRPLVEALRAVNARAAGLIAEPWWNQAPPE